MYVFYRDLSCEKSLPCDDDKFESEKNLSDTFHEEYDSGSEYLPYANDNLSSLFKKTR